MSLELYEEFSFYVKINLNTKFKKKGGKRQLGNIQGVSTRFKRTLIHFNTF